MSNNGKTQAKFILDSLLSLLPNPKDNGNLDEILEKNYNSGIEMNNALSLFRNKMDLSQLPGMYKFDQSFLNKMRKLDTKGKESLIYQSTTWTRIPVIIKIPKKTEYHDEVIRSYYIGMAMNKLRYKVPNFVYTFGILTSIDKQIFVVTEAIKGETLDKLIEKLTFVEIINIFMQILFALEVAQRTNGFCHNDLHTENIILRPIKTPYNYTIVLDNNIYTLTAVKYIPVIIDYGLSSIYVGNTTIGPYHYITHGITPFPVQGVDMYKLLFHCYSRVKGELQRQIGSFFLLYGINDPYKILITDPSMLPVISKQYLKKVSYSISATYTPFEFCKWIIECSDYPKIDLVATARNVYFPLQGQLEKQQLEKIYLKSYIMTKYMDKITQMPTKVSEMKLIKNDRKMLEKYKKIVIPDETNVRELSKKICCINIDCANLDRKLIEQFCEITEFIQQLSPYLQYLYTIRELQFENIYEKFVSEFVVSPQYILFDKLSNLIEKTRRWCNTLKQACQ